MGLDSIVHALACPLCAASMGIENGAIACASGHRFDIAREGYVNLLPGGARPSTADTSEMVSARVAFLSAGYFQPLLDSVAEAVASRVANVPGPILDVGGGTGEYLLGALRELPGRSGISFDLSRAACKIAARALPHAGVAVTDVWTRLPLRDASVAAILDVFAPRNAPEFRRVLAPGGILIVVTPTPDHLHELVVALGLITVDPDKQTRLAAALGDHFHLDSTSIVSAPLRLTRDDARTASLMGPSAAHISAEEIDARVRDLDEPFSATLSAHVSVYRPRTRAGSPT